LEKVKPQKPMEFELAYVLSQLDPETEGMKLLSHDLASVREGAWMGLSGVGKVQLIRQLDQERQRRKGGSHLHFQEASYRAIDHALIHIRLQGGKKELEELEKFLFEVQDREGIYPRVEWTIRRWKDPGNHS
jgi:hypothetical protein